VLGGKRGREGKPSNQKLSQILFLMGKKKKRDQEPREGGNKAVNGEMAPGEDGDGGGLGDVGLGDVGPLDLGIDLGLDPVSLLFNLFPNESVQTIRETLSLSQNDVDKAVSVLKSSSNSNSSPSNTTSTSNSDTKNPKNNTSFDTLLSMFPSLSVSRLEGALSDSNGNLEEAADNLCLFLASNNSNTTTCIEEEEEGDDGRRADVHLLKDLYPSIPEKELYDMLQMHGGLHKTIEFLIRPPPGTNTVESNRSSSSAPSSTIPSFKQILSRGLEDRDCKADKDITNYSGRKFVMDSGTRHFMVEPQKKLSNSSLKDKAVYREGNENHSVMEGLLALEFSSDTVPEAWLDPNYCRAKAQEFLYVFVFLF
jgi:hypothetical protein